MKSHLWKGPLIAVLVKDVLKNPGKMSWWEFIVHFLVKPANLLKMNFFTRIKLCLGFNQFAINLEISRTPNCGNIFQWLLLHLHLSITASTIN